MRRATGDSKTRSCVGCDIGTNFGSLGRNGSLRRSFSAFAFAPHFYLHYKQPEDEGEHFSHMKANLRRLSTAHQNTWLDRRLLKASQDCSPSCCILHIPAQRSLEPCRTLELASYSTTFRNYFQKALRPRAQKRRNHIEREPIADIGLSITYGMRLGLGDDSSTIGGH